MEQEPLKSLQKKLGVNIRAARHRRGLSQAEAAEMIGISPEIYGRLERGAFLPPISRLLAICETFGVSADQLLGVRPPEGQLPGAPTTRP